jgi:membrane protease YdiL (CAAX protease family)
LFVRYESLGLADVGARLVAGSMWRFVVGFVIGLILVVVSAAISSAVGYVRWVGPPAIDLRSVAITFVTYVLLSSREELAFHGYPLQRLKKMFGLWNAQLFIAFMFAAEHRLGGLPWRNALLGAGVGSLLFGMGALATRGLAVPIGVHAAWNVGEWSLGLKGSPGIWTAVVAVSDAQAEWFARIGYLVVMSAATFGFWLWYRRETARSRDRPVLPRE